MSGTVTNAFVRTYEQQVRHLAQQNIARLMNQCMVKSVSSEAHNWDRMGQTTASEKTTRKTPTPDDETPWSRRQSLPKTFHTGDVVENSDRVQMLINPDNAYAVAQGRAMNRAHDDEIIAAAVGASRDGSGNSVAFDSNQTLGDGTAAITFGLITDVTQKFYENDIDPMEEKVMVITPRQARNLLNMTEATSGDFNALKPLTSQGYVKAWMGYDWIVSTRLLQGAVGTSKYCFAMTKKAIGFQLNRDIWARITEDPSISYAWRVYCESTFGAIRVEDEQLVRIDLSETA